MGKKVLLIEDEPYLTSDVLDALESEGHSVNIARNGTAALDELESVRDYDVIILDVMLATGDRIHDPSGGRRTGVELLRILRQQMRIDIPVLVLTVVTDRSVKDELRRLGATVIFQKPTDPGDILDAIAHLP